MKKLIGIVLCLLVLFSISTGAAITSGSALYDSQGNAYYSAKNYQDALKYFNMAIAQDASNIDAWMHKGNAQRALKQYNESIVSYSKVLEFNSTNDTKASAWSNIATSYESLKNYTDAFSAVSNAAILKPKDAGFKYRSGYYLQLSGNFQGAMTYFDDALALNPKYKDALYRKGLSEQAMGNSSGAIVLYDNITAMDPKYKQAYNAKGLALEAEGNYSAAVDAYNASLQIDPKYNQAMSNMMHALLALKRYDEAMTYYLKVY